MISLDVNIIRIGRDVKIYIGNRINRYFAIPKNEHTQEDKVTPTLINHPVGTGNTETDYCLCGKGC